MLDTVGLMNSTNKALSVGIYEKKKLSNIPVVCVGIPLENLKTIENSNEQLVREVCRHIIDVHGCKDICLLTGQKDNHEAEERLDIMLDEIHKHGLTVKDEHIIYGDFWYTSSGSYKKYYRA